MIGSDGTVARFALYASESSRTFWNSFYIFIASDVRIDQSRIPQAGSDSTFKLEPMLPFVEQIKEFQFLEQDEDFLPVSETIVQEALNVLHMIYQKDQLLPFIVVPTRSAGIGIEYHVKDYIIYYRLDADGLKQYSVIKDDNLILKNRFTDSVQVLSPSELI